MYFEYYFRSDEESDCDSLDIAESKATSATFHTTDVGIAHVNCKAEAD